MNTVWSFSETTDLGVGWQSEVPGHTGGGSHCTELMNDVTGNEVDVIVMETKVSIADTIPPQLVEFSLLHPLPAL